MRTASKSRDSPSVMKAPGEVTGTALYPSPLIRKRSASRTSAWSSATRMQGVRGSDLICAQCAATERKPHLRGHSVSCCCCGGYYYGSTKKVSDIGTSATDRDGLAILSLAL